MNWKKFVRKSGLAVVLAMGAGGNALANNVQVALEGSLMTVFGDNAANEIVISQSATGDITITGRNGTRVNNGPSARFRRVSLNAIEIRMEGGNDIVNVRSLAVANDLYANLGGGADRFIIPTAMSVGANVTIEGAEGSDTVRLTDLTVGQDLYIEGGIGALTVALSGVNVAFNATVIADEANDNISMTSSAAGGIVSMETKGGVDRVTVSGVRALGASFTTDAGADNVQISQLLTEEDVGVFTGVGNDSVTLTDVISGKSLVVSVDEGADTVVAAAVAVAFDAVFEGGAGTDSFSDFGVTAGVKFEVKEFELLFP